MRLFGKSSWPVRLTTDRVDYLRSIEGPDRLEVHPYTDTPGFKGSDDFFDALVSETETGRKAATFSFGWWFRDQLTIQITSPDLEDVRSLLDSHYPNSRTESYSNPIPEFEVGEYMAAARFGKSADSARPIATESSGGKIALNGDQYPSLLPRLVNENNVRVVLQGDFKPIKSSWFKRGWTGDTGIEMAKYNQMYDDPLKEKLGEDMFAQHEHTPFRTCIRAIAIGPNQEDTQEVITQIANSMDTFKYSDQQTIVPTYRKRTGVIHEAEEAIRRRLPQQNAFSRLINGPNNVFTDEEWRSIFHIPNNEINLADVKWETRESGPGVPREDATFDLEREIPDTPAYQEDSQGAEQLG